MNAFSVYLKRSIILQFLLGIPSGLPLGLTAGVLSAWLSEAGVDKTTIGIFAMMAMPYAFKFMWSPLMDGFSLPLFRRLGKRRGWMLLTQWMMAVCMALMALSHPGDTPLLTGLFAFMLAFSSASHDIAKDAYRVEILPPELQGAGAGSFVLGYRVGHNVLTGVGTFYLATYFGWQMTYFVMAMLMAALSVTIFMVKEPATHAETPKSGLTAFQWLKRFVVEPFAEFLKRPQALQILLFVLLYRMADAFLGIMANPFYLELGFTKIQIADVAKLYGLVALTIGSLVGGAMVFRLGVIRSLWIGGLAAALSNLAFIWQAHVGAEPYALALTISLDNISGGLATAALLAYMASLTNLNFTATQFALLSSLSAVGRTFLTIPSGIAAEQLGWEGFFILSSIIGLPALVVLATLKKQPS